ncbi:MAG: hypothetical protein IPP57_22655 [Candidatus Obscuribacter sp.]|nr:hypothetical protein [Candidatus Obscuribacter sp.]
MSASSKQLMITMGALGTFIVTTGVGYYVGFSQTWNAFKTQPLIGGAPIELQVVKVLKDIPAYGRIDGDIVEEARMYPLASTVTFMALSLTVLAGKSNGPQKGHLCIPA